ncbi:30S ribosomal protein S21 [Candidatus Uzinura diaspidicola str. ASNER]|uniref:Small ribosomal subunit protein bS21 n=1 Tax=Candidatus Uzinura diaspidicola str. ASNER TaxID=1133592 RepID=L7VK20_9FLAO|nr:30S ribosomal protein S21 [Candidatus Uzinura diaspidicola str. ASNER]
MLVVNIKEGETIERAIKRYKRKCDQTQLIKNIKNIQYYLKPSKRKREEIYKAIYKYKLLEKIKDN